MGRLRYLRGWASVTRMMDAGASWSGHERNCSFLNLGDGKFVDASSLTGLDFEDDGRALASVDWDGDGDLDLWFKNRTGPQLRFMRNDLPSKRHHVAFRLQGKRANRDGIGARVEVATDSGKIVRSVACGDGYLSQSSHWLHFGLGEDGTARRVTVRWPGGKAETFGTVATNHRYLLIEASGVAAPVAAPVAKSLRKLSPGVLPLPESAGSFRFMLRSHLSMPPSLVDAVYGGSKPQRAAVINLWSSACPPCLGELRDLADHSGEFDRVGVDLIALGMDEPQNRDAAARLFAEKIAPRMKQSPFSHVGASPDVIRTVEVILDHLLFRQGKMTLPTSLIFNPKGDLQVVHVGGSTAKRLLQDAQEYAVTLKLGAFRSFYPGRWYYRTPRDLEGLAKALDEASQKADAAFYRGQK